MPRSKPPTDAANMFERQRRMMSDRAATLGRVDTKGQVIGINRKHR